MRPGIYIICTLLLLATLNSTYAAPCGNSVIETGEECEDGNALSLDGCSSTCLREQGGWACPAVGSACSYRSDSCTMITGTCPAPIASVCAGSGSSCVGLGPQKAGYGCFCPRGLSGSGISAACQDVDECALEQHICGTFLCINGYGTYTCNKSAYQSFGRVDLELYVFITTGAASNFKANPANEANVLIETGVLTGSAYSLSADGRLVIPNIPAGSSFSIQIFHSSITRSYVIQTMENTNPLVTVTQKKTIAHCTSTTSDLNKITVVMYWEPNFVSGVYSAAVDIDFYIYYTDSTNNNRVIYFPPASKSFSDANVAILLTDNFDSGNVNFEIATIQILNGVQTFGFGAQLFTGSATWDATNVRVQFDLFRGHGSLFSSPIVANELQTGRLFEWFPVSATFDYNGNPSFKLFNKFVPITTVPDTAFKTISNDVANCKNNIINIPEQCDSVAASCNAECKCASPYIYSSSSSSCILPQNTLCGNGVVDGTEQCDNSANCRYDCLCKDGFLPNPTSNQCTEVNECALGWHNCDLVNAACTDLPFASGAFSCTCNAGFVGNGMVCMPTTCGNGLLDAGEQCDDGNQLINDGCSCKCRFDNSGILCTINPAQPYNISNPYSLCNKLNSCGNGRIDFDEQCDDGNRNAEDGCSSTCTVEHGGWTCNIFTIPSVCTRDLSFCAPNLCGTAVARKVCGTGNSVCTNNQNSDGFSCSCPRGYSGNGYNSTCVDVDECSTGRHNCASASPSHCTNTVGSWSCIGGNSTKSLALVSSSVTNIGTTSTTQINTCNLTIPAIPGVQNPYGSILPCSTFLSTIVTRVETPSNDVPYTIMIEMINSGTIKYVSYHRISNVTTPFVQNAVAALLTTKPLFIPNTVFSSVVPGSIVVVYTISNIGANVAPEAWLCSGISCGTQITSNIAGISYSISVFSTDTNGLRRQTIKMVMALASPNNIELDLSRAAGVWGSPVVQIYINNIMIHYNPISLVAGGDLASTVNYYVITNIATGSGTYTITPQLRDDGSSVKCGDGFLKFGEECDYGTVSNPACVFCKCIGPYIPNGSGQCVKASQKSVCGDGVVDTSAGEMCESGSLCTSACVCSRYKNRFNPWHMRTNQRMCESVTEQLQSVCNML